MNDDFAELYGAPGHIISLNPLRPENAPDGREREALLAFEDGAAEVREQTEIDSDQYLRFMRPMVTEESCLKCHVHRGFEIGDIRGDVLVRIMNDAQMSKVRPFLVALPGSQPEELE